jgi:glycosyltransferase involved in cell wall biosynthesis
MTSKRIWYISKYVSPPSGLSVGGRGYELMRELAAMGHDCLIITSNSNHLADVPEFEGPCLIQQRDGLQVCWVRTMKARKAKSLRRVASWLHFEWALFWLRKRRFQRPDVIVVSSLSLFTIINGLLLRARFKARLVVEIRDIWPLTLVEEGGFSRRNPLIIALGLIERLGYRHADAIVGTMPNLGEHVANVLGYAKPAHCVPMGFAPRAVAINEPLPTDYVESFIPRDGFVIGYAGAIGITNALDPFFEAVDAMRDDPATQFLVVGDGGLLLDYQNRFSHLPNLTFGPQVPKQAVQSVLAACDLVYFSTHKSRVWEYGQSLNKVIDYMLSGKPVVASYTGYPSMLNEAGCGTYVPAGDVPALVQELRRYASMSQAERSEIGERGRTWILEHRSYRGLAEDYLPILFPESRPRV